jgi:hypothetical protein
MGKRTYSLRLVVQANAVGVMITCQQYKENGAFGAGHMVCSEWFTGDDRELRAAQRCWEWSGEVARLSGLRQPS